MRSYLCEIIFDAEFDGLHPTKMHCISACKDQSSITTRFKKEDVNKLFTANSNDSVFIGHNIIQYDVPQLQRLHGLHLSDYKYIDTLAISWYLFPTKLKHGLEEWGEYLEVKKVKVDDWVNGTIKDYTKRCERDVEINRKLWSLFKTRLLEMYGTIEEVYRVCYYLTFKVKQAQLARDSRFKLDVPTAENNLKTLEGLSQGISDKIKPYMPDIPVYKTITKPKVMYKKDFSLTEAGKRWYNITEEQHLDPLTTEAVQVFKENKEPNPGSSVQVKDWLFSLGWEPETFKKNKKDDMVPQLSKLDGSSLCESVLKLAKDNEAILELEDLFTINSRIGVLKGFLKNKDQEDYLVAEINGFTNTLRMKHKTLVNLPSISSKYGEYIRSCLISRGNKILCGSDMSSLEDRTKQHYMVDYDPKYVEEMNTEGFDPHLDIALEGKLMTQKDVDDYKAGIRVDELKPIRHSAKTTNYSATYGAFPAKIAKSAGISLEEGQKLYDTYWQRNWSIKEIANNCHVQEFHGLNWLWNPVSKMWYWLKYDKDRFSTLNQGTGSYCFDVWVGYILQERPQLTAQFHDEVVLEIGEEEKEEVTLILKQSIKKVNKHLKLKRDLDIDVQFGDNYGQIH